MSALTVLRHRLEMLTAELNGLPEPSGRVASDEAMRRHWDYNQRLLQLERESRFDDDLWDDVWALQCRAGRTPWNCWERSGN